MESEKHGTDRAGQGVAPGYDDGVAEIIGALLLIAIISVTVGIVAIVAFSNVSSVVETPALRVGLYDDSGNISLLHQGGDPMYRQTTRITVDGVDRTDDFENEGEGGVWNTFSTGDLLTSFVPYAEDAKVQIIYTASENPTVIEELSGQPEVSSAPVANFSFSPTSGYAPLEVSFEDQSSGDTTSYYWDFGDGNTSTVSNPSHTYASSGTYEVTLTVCNGDACTSITKSITVFGFSDFVVNESVFVYGDYVYLHGGNDVTGTGSTVIITGDLENNGGVHLYVTNVYVDGSVDLGGSAVLGSETDSNIIYITGDMSLKGDPNVYGDTYVEGNVDLGDSSYIHGDLYTNGNLNFGTGDLFGETHVNGDFTMTNTGTIHGNMYINGDLSLEKIPAIDDGVFIYYTGSDHKENYPQDIIDKCIHVDSVPEFSMPEFIGMPIPSAKSSDWYGSRGYVLGSDVSVLKNGTKIYSESGYSKTWRWNDEGAENIVIIAKTGDITLDRFWNIPVTGVLFAPNGKVTYTGSSFEGVVIAKDGFYVTNGGTGIVFKNLDEYIADPADYPF
ncbi:PKD repeat protein [Methanomicrobium sp. W14]|uniref:PKD domain-containing protein n=1 Tax=Methanomicrobium sp. W14 TaxID=2817839 RepID=UPI001AE39A4C|nr:PKD domain-containing protein [Methanomicrobium sp. W14]MBP2132089.1 PKD repeat protein [Methanomicrobium sp. W14]